MIGFLPISWHFLTGVLNRGECLRHGFCGNANNQSLTKISDQNNVATRILF